MEEKILFLTGGAKKLRVSISDIMYIHMEDHYGRVHLSDGTKCLWRKPLSELEKSLSDFGFERCHNSYIVNMEHVKFREHNRFTLSDETVIPIGRTYARRIGVREDTR